MGRQGVVLKRKKGRREAKSLNNFSEIKRVGVPRYFISTAVRPTTQIKMVNKFKEKAKKLWNMINGKDKNFDGKVDIHDAMLEAKQKAKNEKS